MSVPNRFPPQLALTFSHTIVERTSVVALKLRHKYAHSAASDRSRLSVPSDHVPRRFGAGCCRDEEDEEEGRGSNPVTWSLALFCIHDNKINSQPLPLHTQPTLKVTALKAVFPSASVSSSGANQLDFRNHGCQSRPYPVVQTQPNQLSSSTY